MIKSFSKIAYEFKLVAKSCRIKTSKGALVTNFKTLAVLSLRTDVNLIVSGVSESEVSVFVFIYIWYLTIVCIKLKGNTQCRIDSQIRSTS